MGTCKKHDCCKENALTQAEAMCESKNLRFTAWRRKVFEALWESHKALTPPEIMERIGNTQPPITYRALDFLRDNGLAHQIISLNAYVGCPNPADEDHACQMLVCTSCKDVLELPSAKAVKTLNNEADSIGFSAKHTVIETLGICKNCLANDSRVAAR